MKLLIERAHALEMCRLDCQPICFYTSNMLRKNPWNDIPNPPQGIGLFKRFFACVWSIFGKQLLKRKVDPISTKDDVANSERLLFHFWMLYQSFFTIKNSENLRRRDKTAERTLTRYFDTSPLRGIWEFDTLSPRSARINQTN